MLNADFLLTRFSWISSGHNGAEYRDRSIERILKGAHKNLDNLTYVNPFLQQRRLALRYTATVISIS